MRAYQLDSDQHVRDLRTDLRLNTLEEVLDGGSEPVKESCFMVSSKVMSEIIGEFPTDTVQRCDTRLVLDDALRPLRWEMCLALATTLAAAWQDRLAAQGGWEPRQLTKVVAAIRFTLNELLENAIKYRSGGPIELGMGLQSTTWRCVVGNYVDEDAGAALRKALPPLIEQPSELLFRRQIQHSMRYPERGMSQLGLLSLRSHYHASLAWRLTPAAAELLYLESMASLVFHKGGRPMEIKGDTYRVWFDADRSTVTFEGSLALERTADYEPVERLLLKAAEGTKSTILDVRSLRFLNSTGITAFFTSASALTSREDQQLTVVGSRSIPWQSEVLPKLQEYSRNVELKLTE